MPAIKAREHLEFITNVGCLMAKSDDARMYRELLAKRAFSDNPKLLAQVLMKMGA